MNKKLIKLILTAIIAISISGILHAGKFRVFYMPEKSPKNKADMKRARMLV